MSEKLGEPNIEEQMEKNETEPISDKEVDQLEAEFKTRFFKIIGEKGQSKLSALGHSIGFVMIAGAMYASCGNLMSIRFEKGLKNNAEIQKIIENPTSKLERQIDQTTLFREIYFNTEDEALLEKCITLAILENNLDEYQADIQSDERIKLEDVTEAIENLSFLASDDAKLVDQQLIDKIKNKTDNFHKVARALIDSILSIKEQALGQLILAHYLESDNESEEITTRDIDYQGGHALRKNIRVLRMLHEMEEQSAQEVRTMKATSKAESIMGEN